MPCARLGLIVGKRVAPRAVDRNLARRIIRESFRVNRRRLPNFDLVVQVVERGGNKVMLNNALETLWQELASRG